VGCVAHILSDGETPVELIESAGWFPFRVAVVDATLTGSRSASIGLFLCEARNSAVTPRELSILRTSANQPQKWPATVSTTLASLASGSRSRA
jgi:hypothetical protein